MSPKHVHAATALVRSSKNHARNAGAKVASKKAKPNQVEDSLREFREGTRLRSPGNGEAGIGRGVAGDLYVVVHLKEAQGLSSRGG